MTSTSILAGASGAHAAERATLLKLFDAAVGSVSAARVMPRVLPAPLHGRVALIAVGKAAAAMTEVALDRMAPPSEALVVSRHGHMIDKLAGRARVELIEAGHPYPDSNSVLAANRALEIAHGLGAQDHLQ